MQSVGIPIALYIDRHGVFRHTPGYGLPGTATQFSRAMDELGIQMIFALSPQAKGRVEQAAGTFQDRLVTELRLAGASSIREANGVLEQFLPRYNRRFRVPPQCSESAYRPLGPDLSLEQVLCFKHRRKVARDNTVKFQLHTLQLLPEPERPSYSGAVVEVLEDWTAGSGCAMRDASSTPGRRRPARHSSATAMEIRPLLLPRPPGPNTLTSAGQRHSSHWTQGQRMRRIKRA